MNTRYDLIARSPQKNVQPALFPHGQLRQEIGIAKQRPDLSTTL